MKTALYVIAAVLMASGLIKLVLAFVQWRRSRKNG